MLLAQDFVASMFAIHIRGKKTVNEKSSPFFQKLPPPGWTPDWTPR
jgi:hypothetical protein